MFTYKIEAVNFNNKLKLILYPLGENSINHLTIDSYYVSKVSKIIYFTISSTIIQSTVDSAYLHICPLHTYIAVSFYSSQNVLCQSKFFEPPPKFDCI